MAQMAISLIVNGQQHWLAIPDHEVLLATLRERLGLTGTKCGCAMGTCGACTVLVEGEPTLSCLLLTKECEGKKILTIEGLKQGSSLHPIQQAFIKAGAVQCGFCSPGFILTAKALLDRQPDPPEDEIKEAISGNYCRCTGYVKIVKAIQSAARGA
jgi:carbon-monoxide dehydrogenase small subunit